MSSSRKRGSVLCAIEEAEMALKRLCELSEQEEDKDDIEEELGEKIVMPLEGMFSKHQLLEVSILEHMRSFIVSRCGELNKIDERIFVLTASAYIPDNYGEELVRSEWSARKVTKNEDLIRKSILSDGTVAEDRFEHKASTLKKSKGRWQVHLNLDFGADYKKASTVAGRDDIMWSKIDSLCGGQHGGLILEAKYQGLTLDRFYLSNSFLVGFCRAYFRYSKCKAGTSHVIITSPRCKVCEHHHFFERLMWMDRTFGFKPRRDDCLRSKRTGEILSMMLPQDAFDRVDPDQWQALFPTRREHHCKGTLDEQRRKARRKKLPEWEIEMLLGDD